MRLTGFSALMCKYIAVAMSTFHIYTAVTGSMVTLLQRSIHLAFAFSLVFLIFPARKKAPADKSIPIIDIFLALLAAASFLYVSFNYEMLRQRMAMVDPLSSADIFFGISAIILVMEGARRALGMALVIIPAISLLYAYFGSYFPGVFWHRGFNITQIVDYMYLGSDGIFGMPVGISATYLMLFIVFGCLMEKTGTGQMIMDLACSLAGKSRGGPAKVAVISSALFGSVSGTAVSNVYASGIFTIPLMKKLGYKPEFAGAVEAVASTGGQIVPPVLGAVAFIMAEWLGMSYKAVCIATIIPAILYYVAVLLMVHLEAVKSGMSGLPDDQIIPFRKMIKKLYLLLPLVILMGMLMLGFTVTRSAVIAMAVGFVLSFFKKETRLSIADIIWILETSAKRGASIAAATASAGLIIGVVTLTGLGLSITGAIASYFQDYLFIALFFAMVASIILGMGVPTVVAYIIVATISAPILINLGVDLFPAHMFVFYYGVMAMVTPPVAVAAWAAADIAEADYNKTSFVAVRLAVVAFIIPFMFVYEPSLLGIGTLFEVIRTFIFALIGVTTLSCGLAGWLYGPINIVLRTALLFSGIAMIYPELKTTFIGLAVLCFTTLYQKHLAKKMNTIA